MPNFYYEVLLSGTTEELKSHFLKKQATNKTSKNFI
jgi:hypothetical protein